MYDVHKNMMHYCHGYNYSEQNFKKIQQNLYMPNTTPICGEIESAIFVFKLVPIWSL